MRQHRSGGGRDDGPELRADSQTLSEKKKSKMCSVNTVSAALVRVTAHPARCQVSGGKVTDVVAPTTPSVSMVPECEF
jgi:hypothetical protein